MKLFRDMLAQGIMPEHVLKELVRHRRDLVALAPDVEGRDDAIALADAFIVEIRTNYGLEADPESPAAQPLR